MPWTADEIVRDLARTQPQMMESTGSVVCFFCNALIGTSGLEEQHAASCVWNAAVEHDRDR